MRPLNLRNTEKLLSCPFCGSSEISIEAINPEADGGREVQCVCGVIAYGKTEAEAVAIWQRRTWQSTSDECVSCGYDPCMCDQQ